LFSCDEPTKPPAITYYDSLTALKPEAGAVLQAGTAVTIEWGYPKDWPYKKVVVEASISNSKIPNWKTISIDPVICPQATFQWAIPSGQTGDSCRIKIYDYDKNKYAYSGYFKVTN
jgi:hypothetical protein